MTLLPKRDVEKRPEMMSFRCPSGLRKRLNDRAESRGYSRSKVIEVVLDFGLEVWSALEPIWDRVEIVAKEHGESFPAALRRIAELGLAAYEKERRSRK